MLVYKLLLRTYKVNSVETCLHLELSRTYISLTMQTLFCVYIDHGYTIPSIV